jgi:hypothetical protein
MKESPRDTGGLYCQVSRNLLAISSDDERKIVIITAGCYSELHGVLQSSLVRVLSPKAGNLDDTHELALAQQRHQIWRRGIEPD